MLDQCKGKLIAGCPDMLKNAVNGHHSAEVFNRAESMPSAPSLGVKVPVTGVTSTSKPRC